MILYENDDEENVDYLNVGLGLPISACRIIVIYDIRAA